MSVRSIGIAMLSFTLITSQIIFPWFDEANPFPLFTWDLFSSAARPAAYYDLRLTLKNGESCYFSTCSTRELNTDGVRAFYLIQQLGREFHNERLTEENRQNIKALLRPLQLSSPPELILVNSYFSDHIVSQGATSDLKNMGTL